MKKLFFTFIALLIVFFSAWGIKLRMPINRPNNVQGEQQVAWYETRYTAPTAEEEWTLDPEIPVNYLPVAGEDEVYMVLDDSGNIVGYRHRTQQEDGSWLWTDIEDPNAEHYEKVDGLDHIYKVTDKDGTSSYQQYVRNEDGSYAYVPVNENGVPLDDGADATTIDTTHYVHKSGNVYGLYNDNGVLTGYRERVKDGENYVWKVTDPPKSSTSDLQEWSEAKKDNANQGDLSADSGDGTQNSGNNGVIVGGSGAESSQIDNGDGTYSYASGEKLYESVGGAAVPVDSYEYLMLDMDKTGYGMDDNKTVGTELFSRIGTDRYIKTTGDNGETIYLRNNLNETDYESLYKLGNLKINPEAAQNVGKIPLSTVQGKEDFDRAKELVDIWDEKFASLNPDMYAKSDYMSFYNNYIGEYATMGKALYNYVGNQTTMVDGYDNQRLQSEGVSSDEELEKMIKYQQAYNAASRYVNVVSEMLEHLVTSLGRI